MRKYLRLIRINQWYKNLLVFLAIFFSGNLFNQNMFFTSVLSFLSLCLVSSSGYILNDLFDLKKDILHPEKKHRPLAEGTIRELVAIVLLLLLLILGLFVAYNVGISFFIVVISLFLLSSLYSFFLKRVIFADILIISALFAGRAIAGALAINVWISPWLILCPFFLSLFLVVGKRHGEILLLGEKASLTREVLIGYTKEITNSLMIISTTLLAISYALYSFLSQNVNLLFTLPFALFVIFRYYYLIIMGSIIARNPERVIFDKQMIVGMLLWVIVAMVVVYR